MEKLNPPMDKLNPSMEKLHSPIPKLYLSMQRLIKAGRIFYGISMAAIGFQQMYYSDFHPMLLPPLHNWIPGLAFWAWLTGAALMATGAAIIFEKRARTVSLVLGGVLLVLFCIYYIPYELIVDPYYRHLGEWGEAEKELALAGGAFVVAGSFRKDPDNTEEGLASGDHQSLPVRLLGKPLLIGLLEKLIPLGGAFFSITMISFGIDHFLYTQPISTMIPDWIPHHIFWTYFAAVALIGAGSAIILRFKLPVIATLLGTMIFLWFVFLHIPGAIAQPFTDKGNEVTSAFSALAFSGIAFVIAGNSYAGKDKLPLNKKI